MLHPACTRKKFLFRKLPGGKRRPSNHGRENDVNTQKKDESKKRVNTLDTSRKKHKYRRRRVKATGEERQRGKRT